MFHARQRNFKYDNRIISVREPLTDEQIMAVAPSVFQAEAHSSRSERYKPIQTSAVLAGLRKEGFLPFAAFQGRTRDESKREFTKHRLRLRHVNWADKAGGAFEIDLQNGNDGSSAWKLRRGWLRFVCENGAITSESFGEDLSVRHSGRAVENVIEGTFRVLEDAEAVTHQVEEFSTRMLTRDHQRILAKAAHVARFGVDEEQRMIDNGIDVEDILQVRRREDRAEDLETVWNRVQENIVRGGLQGRQQLEDGRTRRITTREVAAIDGNTNLNRALWVLKEEMNRLAA